MGNSCCNQDGSSEADIKQLIKNQTKILKQATEFTNDTDLPPPSIAVPISKMLTPSPQALSQEKLLDPLNQELKKKYSELPVAGPLEYQETKETYHGQLRNSKREGYGYSIYPDGSIYEGYWKNDQYNGLGRLILETGEFYEGQFYSGVRQGHGKSVDEEGKEYVGDWKNDQQHGRGVEKYSDGSEYDGDFKDGKRQGEGVFKLKNGSVYEGEFYDDNMDGVGKIIDFLMI